MVGDGLGLCNAAASGATPFATVRDAGGALRPEQIQPVACRPVVETVALSGVLPVGALPLVVPVAVAPLADVCFAVYGGPVARAVRDDPLVRRLVGGRALPVPLLVACDALAVSTPPRSCVRVVVRAVSRPAA